MMPPITEAVREVLSKDARRGCCVDPAAGSESPQPEYWRHFPLNSSRFSSVCCRLISQPRRSVTFPTTTNTSCCTHGRFEMREIVDKPTPRNGCGFLTSCPKKHGSD